MKKFAVNIIRGMLVALSKLPLKFHYFMGDILAWMVRCVFRYRYDVVITNLSRSFPEKKYKAISQMAKDFYRHFGEIVAEAIWFSGSSYKRLYDSGIVTVTNPEVVSRMFENSPSLTVLSAHTGNWELMGGFLGYRRSGNCQYPFGEEQISVVYRRLSNEVADEVFKRNRISPLEDVGTECELESSQVLRFSLKHKDEKRVYIYPTDQSPYGKSARHPIGKFLNQETYSMAGSLGVACKLSHAVLYMKMRRVERGKYEMSFIPICDDASKHTPEELIRKYYDLLEDEIVETPCNWLWTHKRWK